MEVYNTLAREFHDINSPRNNLIQYKKIVDQLNHARMTKKMHLANRLKQFEQITQVKHDNSDSRISVVSTVSVKQIGGTRWEMESMERNDLKKKIGQIQKQIENIGGKTHEINAQLALFINKQQQVQFAGKKSELSMFNAIQELSIAMKHEEQEEIKQKQAINQLTQKRNRLSNEIKQLLKQKQNNKQKLLRLNISTKMKKERKLQTLLQIGVNMTQLKHTVKNMIGLHHLLKRSKQQCLNFTQNISIQQEIKQVVEPLMKEDTKYGLLEHLKGLNYSFDNSFVLDISKLYSKLQSEFDRNERTNQYLNNHLKSLNIKYDKLITIIDCAKLTTKKQTQEKLDQKQFFLNQKQQSLKGKCKIITSFTNKYHFLVDKLISLKQTAYQIMKNQIGAYQIEKLRESKNVLNNYGQYVNRNPEDSRIKWAEIIGNFSQFYNRFIDTNDVLRLFSSPELYNYQMDELTNYDVIMTQCFKIANDFIKKLSTQVISFFRSYPCSVKIHQFGSSYASIDSITPENGHFCIQSKDYHRRDNYKLLDKLHKIELKKKGLLTTVPFNICMDSELQNYSGNQESVTCSNTPKDSFSQRYLKYTNLATRREENTNKHKEARKMFNKLSSLQSRPQSSRFLNLKSMKQQSMCTSRANFSSIKRSKTYKNTITMSREYRHTAGSPQKENN